MNPARLIGGWLLLCGLSAGGAYFGMDEVDQRYDLSKYDLRAKVGLSASPSPTPVQPVPSGPTGGASPAPSVAPPPYQPAYQPPYQPPVNPAPKPNPSGGGNPVQPPIQPSGGRQIPGRPNPTNPGGSTNPGPIGGGGSQPSGGGGGASPTGGGATPTRPNPTQPDPVKPPAPNPNPPNPQVPSSTGPAPGPSQPVNRPAPSTDPTATRANPKDTDEWRALQTTYEQMSPRSQAVLGYLTQMKQQTERNRGVFRTDLETAMIGLRESMTAARRALDAGQIETARGYLATAYRQLGYLEQNRR